MYTREYGVEFDIIIFKIQGAIPRRIFKNWNNSLHIFMQLLYWGRIAMQEYFNDESWSVYSDKKVQASSSWKFRFIDDILI